jgi:DNA-binding HxlR family transcriptional regulator
MPRRSYDHYCAIARALDHLGERWALLIVRELSAGPRRYSDLLVDLPGISTDVLATRLRELETDGIVTRRQGGMRTYQLTPAGLAAAPILDALADWGAARSGGRGERDAMRAHWLGPPLARRLSRLGTTASGTVEFRVDGTAFHLRIEAGRAAYGDGPAADPDVVAEASAETAMDLASGAVTLPGAVGSGVLTLTGDSALIEGLCRSAAEPLSV